MPKFGIAPNCGVALLPHFRHTLAALKFLINRRSGLSIAEIPGHVTVFTETSMNPAQRIVRWILVVTLGCSLGLLLVFVLRSSGLYPEPVPAIQVVHRTIAAEAPFRISQEDLEKELQRVIAAQLTAFRDDDYPKAFEFAAAAIKAQMSLPDFERMVKRNFPPIAHNHEAQFGVVVDNGGNAVVAVTIVSSGRTRHYQYILEHERDGWKIAGVVEVKSIGTTI